MSMKVIPQDFKYVNADHLSNDHREVINKYFNDNPKIQHDDCQYIRVFDETLELVLYHYLTYIGEDGKEFIHPSTSHVKGIIIDKTNKKVVVAVNDYNRPDVKFSPELFTDESYSCYPLYEGVVLRLFYFGDGWKLSTCKKIDASKSKWNNSPTFSEYMDKLKTVDYKNLDKGNMYVFCLKSPYTPCVYNFTEKLVEINEVGTVISREEIVKRFENMNILSKDCKEFGFYIPELGNVYHPDYLLLKEARGTDASLKTRWLYVRNTPQENLLLKLYGDSIPNEVELSITKLATRLLLLHQTYNADTVYDKEEYVSLKNLAKIKKGLDHKSVLSYLNSTDPKYVARMLKRLDRT